MASKSDFEFFLFRAVIVACEKSVREGRDSQPKLSQSLDPDSGGNLSLTMLPAGGCLLGRFRDPMADPVTGEMLPDFSNNENLLALISGRCICLLF